MTKIAVSSGDPAGIGPDICIKAFGNKKILSYKPIVFGNIDLFIERAKQINQEIDIREYKGEEEDSISNDFLWMVDMPIGVDISSSKPNPKSAEYIINIFEESVNKTISKEFDAIVTCPINKEIINEGGIPFTGHTEELAKLGKTNKVVMMLANQKIKVALASTHIPLNEVSDFINKGHIEEVVEIIHTSLRDYWNANDPLIKVLGINPHAGDGGYIGKEEKEVISPALQNLKEKGINTIGPISADTAFIEKDGTKKADAFLAMFHDQGLPVIKTMGFGETVNITLGLPFIRTSVDHGTAYDKAGLGSADESSLIAAMEMAFSMSKKNLKDATS
jgi:4-hydroxythreonine-4-phosphate dehydrogenase|tara:strand:+ start:110 stop:1111 length:1002 start_codon:yes stop_codon:yes gene_type:complete